MPAPRVFIVFPVIFSCGQKYNFIRGAVVHGGQAHGTRVGQNVESVICQVLGAELTASNSNGFNL